MLKDFDFVHLGLKKAIVQTPPLVLKCAIKRQIICMCLCWQS